MNCHLAFYLLIVFFIELLGRFGTRDAFEYKKSNSRIKKQKKEYSIFRNLFKVYPFKDSFAPRHMKLFFLVRITNFISTSIAIILVVFLSNQFDSLLICYIVVFTPIAIVDVPFVLYMVFLVINSDYPRKRITFDGFKNP